MVNQYCELWESAPLLHPPNFIKKNHSNSSRLEVDFYMKTSSLSEDMTKIKEVDIIKTCWTGSGNLVSHCFHTLPVILHSLHCRLVAIAREDTTRCFPSRTVPKVSFCHSGTSLFSVERKKKGTNYRETFHPFCILSHFVLFFYFPFFLMSILAFYLILWFHKGRKGKRK